VRCRMYVIRDGKGAIFNKHYETEQEAQQIIDNRARSSEYARKFWYVEEVEEND